MAATKSERYVGEMREIAATQAAAGLTPALFEAIAEVYGALAESELARSSPEDVAPDLALRTCSTGSARGRSRSPRRRAAAGRHRARPRR